MLSLLRVKLAGAEATRAGEPWPRQTSEEMALTTVIWIVDPSVAS